MKSMEITVKNRQVIEVYQDDVRYIKLELEKGRMTYIWTDSYTPADAFVELGRRLQELGY